ncbi:hypothetical protein ASA1KI_27240 [Opitutales bacterium ASA1]|uniref:hypothetical protein n=1 Tax=Congregicoccus parvus TaxID=3081749 RepID=UPI002B29D5B3|nr:hypothetical protein ASA1KI_27240 [Opitutales bacterium ASA1]
MKFLVVLLFGFVLLACAAWWGWETMYPKFLDKWSELAPPSFPVDRVLTDRTGRTVAVRVLARSDTEVRFVRESDGVGFQYAIASLSDADQAFLRRFPTSPLGPLPEQATLAAQHSREVALRRERAELEHRIALWMLELEKVNTKSPSHSRDEIRQRVDDAKNRIVDIDKLLLDLAFRASR